MTRRDDDILEGMTLDSSTRLTLSELCDVCAVSSERITELVDEGVIEPQGRRPQEWRFTSISVRRIRFAERVERDLHVNPAGAALALDLLDEIERLRAKLGRPV